MKCMLFALAMMAAAPAFAAKPVTQGPDQWLQQLQANPADDALRQRIIAAIPAGSRPVSREAREAAGAARYLTTGAVSKAEWLSVAAAWDNAARLAPWVAEFYRHAGEAYQVADRGDEAVKAYHWYLVAASGAADAAEIAQRIDSLKPAAEGFESLLRKINHRRYVWRVSSETGIEEILEIDGTTLRTGGSLCNGHFAMRARDRYLLITAEPSAFKGGAPAVEITPDYVITVTGFKTESRQHGVKATFTISPDGETIKFESVDERDAPDDRLYRWQSTETPVGRLMRE